jgi:hypothetical protein
MFEFKRSEALKAHLREIKKEDTLNSIGVSKKVKLYIRNLQEKNIGNGCFDKDLHARLLSKVKSTTKARKSLFLKNKTLILNEGIQFSFHAKRFELVKPKEQDLQWATKSDALTVFCITVTHKDEKGRTFEHDTCAIVCKRKMYYFDFNDHGYYTRKVAIFFDAAYRKVFGKRLNFKAVFDLGFLFPEYGKHGRIAVQDGKSVAFFFRHA